MGYDDLYAENEKSHYFTNKMAASHDVYRIIESINHEMIIRLDIKYSS